MINRKSPEHAPPIPEMEQQDTPEAKFEVGIVLVQKLAFDFHKMKGELAANTQLTKELADGQVQLAAGQRQLRAAVDQIDLSALTDFLEAVSSMRGGIKVLGWLERPAKWIAAIGGAVAIIYSLWGHK